MYKELLDGLPEEKVVVKETIYTMDINKKPKKVLPKKNYFWQKVFILLI
jgi:hypothetical protein